MLNIMLCLLLGYQDLKVPPEIKVESGKFITIVAETKGEEVKFVPLTDGLQVLDKAFLKDPKQFIAVAKDGTYKLLCYTAVGGKLSDPAYTIIKVGQNDDVKPENNKLKEIVLAVYGADTSPDKTKTKDKMIEGFTQVLKEANSIKTVSDLNKAVKNKVSSLLNAGEGTALRQVLSDHLKANFGVKPENTISEDKIKSVLNEMLNALGAL